MLGNRIEKLVAELVADSIAGSAMELVKVTFTKEQGKRFLRVFLDREGGINLADCQVVAQVLSRRLDEEDPIPENYFLEVSSAGLERPLNLERDYHRFMGNNAQIRTGEALDGSRNFRGKLCGVEEGKVLLEGEGGKILRIPLAIITGAHLLADWTGEGKKGEH